MIDKVKLAMHIKTDIFDSEILDLIAQAIADIQHAGATFTSTEVKDSFNNISDYTVTDPLAQRAIVTFCRLNMGSPSDYDRLKASYDEQKAQMRESVAYGMEEL